VGTVWTTIYESKGPQERSWTQQFPDESWRLIATHGSGPEHAVVDVGGGASVLALALLERGYLDVTVVDIAPPALAELRALATDHGHRPESLSTVVCDVLDFDPPKRFATWHDRAVFHFLVESAQQVRYRERLNHLLQPGGLAIVATFSPNGPTMCSGLPVKQWSTESLAEFFAPEFDLIEAFLSEHHTPNGTAQSFSWVALRRVNTPITR
jgi:SAM-dependent methyltransferase